MFLFVITASSHCPSCACLIACSVHSFLRRIFSSGVSACAIQCLLPHHIDVSNNGVLIIQQQRNLVTTKQKHGQCAPLRYRLPAIAATSVPHAPPPVGRRPTCWRGYAPSTATVHARSSAPRSSPLLFCLCTAD